MMHIIPGLIKESIALLNRMSPYLLFGFLFAGILRMFLSPGFIARHLGGSSFISVIKASLLGVPLPLCSCGVIPAAVSLRKEGAGKGAVLSFLISTPTTGVDSVFVTYSLLGGFFAVYRVVTSFLAGALAGIMENLFGKEEEGGARESTECSVCGQAAGHGHGVTGRSRAAFRYAFGELVGDTGPSLLAGILIGGAISYFIPASFVSEYMGAGWLAMAVMFLVGMPMYVCATGSVPIAAALLLKGMAPGAVFVFLLSGPATNAAGLAVIARQIGRRSAAIYILSIAFMSAAGGAALNLIWGYVYRGAFTAEYQKALLPGWAGIASSTVLVGLIIYNISLKHIRKRKRECSDAFPGRGGSAEREER